jgi:hypothetical protein
MSSANLIRFGGLAAMIAGLLRGVNSFLPSSSGLTSELLYLLTDIFLVFGVIGLYGFQHQESGWWGFWGFVLAIIGITVIRTGIIAGVKMYAIGALIFAAGLILLALGSWVANKLPRWVAGLWIFSTMLGFIGYFLPGFSVLFAISGVLFGVGFAVGGLQVWLATSRSLH